MIKINLLAEGRRPTAVRKAKPGIPLLERDDIAQWTMLLVIVLALLVAGGFWFKAHRDLEAKKREVAAAQAEVKKLEAVLEEVAEFKAKKAELEHKIAVINELKQNQRGPVRVLDSISRALPELLWLDKMTMKPGNITLNGKAFNINAVANFIDRLDQVPEFSEPILRDSSQTGSVYNFAITFNYSFVPLTGGAEGDDSQVARASAGS